MSTTPSAAKGARGEREVREIFEAGGFLQAQRSRAGAAEDRGDLAGIPDLTPFYHVHSHVPVPDDPTIVLGSCDYGTRFATVVGRGNIMGTQFHPEKSSRDGIALLSNFVALCGVRGAVAA